MLVVRGDVIGARRHSDGDRVAVRARRPDFRRKYLPSLAVAAALLAPGVILNSRWRGTRRAPRGIDVIHPFRQDLRTESDRILCLAGLAGDRQNSCFLGVAREMNMLRRKFRGFCFKKGVPC